MYRTLVFLILVSWFSPFALAQEDRVYVRLDPKGPVIPNNAHSKLSQLVHSHPVTNLTTGFIENLGKAFIIQYKDDALPAFQGGCDGLASVITVEIPSMLKTGYRMPALIIYTQYLLGPESDRQKQFVLVHEYTHLVQKWRIGPPIFTSRHEPWQRRTPVTKEFVEEVYRDELEAYEMEVQFAKLLKFKPDWEPHLSRAKGGYPRFCFEVARFVAMVPDLTPFQEFLLKLAARKTR